MAKVADWPLNFTPVTPAKLLPLIVTVEPLGPKAGVKEEIEGATAVYGEMLPVTTRSSPAMLLMYQEPDALVPPHDTILNVTVVPGGTFCKPAIPLKSIAF